MTEQRFVVDILDSSGNLQGAGPIVNAVSATVEEKLDEAGLMTITVPAHDQRAIDLLASSARMRLVTGKGYTRTAIIQQFDLLAGEMPLFSASGPDLLAELTFYTCGYNRRYDDQDVMTAIVGTDATATSLLGGTGWTQGSVEDYGNTTISYNAETRLRALAMLGEQLGRHIRQGSTEQTLDFGVFGADSGIRILNVDAYRFGQEAVDDQAYLMGIPRVSYVSSEIYNRLFPLGKDKFDLRDATTGTILVASNGGPEGVETTTVGAITTGDTSFTVASATGLVKDTDYWIGDKSDWSQTHEVVSVSDVSGTTVTIIGEFVNSYGGGVDVIQFPQFYIEDTASQATHGVREHCPQFGWIAPPDVSSELALQQQAADCLYAAAQATLTRHKDEYESITLPEVANLPLDLLVGQKVRVRYNGVVGLAGGAVYRELDDDYYVLSISRTWEATGREVATLEVANVSRPMPNNVNLIIFNLDNNRWIGL